MRSLPDWLNNRFGHCSNCELLDDMKRAAEGADEIFVSGHSLFPNAQALEPLLEARMFAAVEA